MKHIRRALYAKLLIFLTFLLILLFPQKAQADDVQYSIPKVDIDAQIQTDGSLKMTTKVTYHFDSNAHGVHYYHSLTGKQKLLSPSVKVKINHGKWKTYPDTSQETGDSHNYQMAPNGTFTVNDPNIKTGDTINVLYKFLVTNAVINWQDTSELSMTMLGKNTSVDIDNVKIWLSFANKNFNEANNYLEVYSWTNSGNPAGKVDVNVPNRTATVSAKNFSADSSLVLHALFPLAYTVSNKNVKDQAHLAQAKEDEQKQMHKYQRKQFFKAALLFLLVALFGVGLIYLIKKAFFDKPLGLPIAKLPKHIHTFEIPTVDPVIAQVLTTGEDPDSEAFVGQITQFIAQDKLKITKLSRKNYQLDVVDKNVLNESSLLKATFVEARTNMRTVTTRKIKRTHLQAEASYWRQTMMRKAARMGLVINYKEREKVQNTAKQLKALSFFAIIAAILIAVFSRADYRWVLVGILLTFAIAARIIRIFYNRRVGILTEKGAEMSQQIISFKNALNDIGKFSRRDLPELPLWEDIMPYAVSFGISKKVLKKLKFKFKDESDSPIFDISDWYISGTNYLSNTYDSSFTTSDGGGGGLISSLGDSLDSGSGFDAF